MPGSLRHAGVAGEAAVNLSRETSLNAIMTVGAGGSLRHEALTDPGNAAAVPVTRDGYVAIVTAGAETRGVDIPTYVGQRLLMFFDTDGGNCVFTFSQNVETTDGGDHNTLTWDTVGDGVELVGVTVASALRWAVVSDLGGAVVGNWTSV